MWYCREQPHIFNSNPFLPLDMSCEAVFEDQKGANLSSGLTVNILEEENQPDGGVAARLGNVANRLGLLCVETFESDWVPDAVDRVLRKRRSFLDRSFNA